MIGRWLFAALLLYVCLSAVACNRGAKKKPDFDASSHRERARVPAVAFAAFSRDATAALGADGKADIEGRRDATADTVFDAASLGKIVVAVTVMQLVETKRASLDEDVSHYVGFGVLHKDKPVTLRMLLSHTGAVRDRNLVETEDAHLGKYLQTYFARPDAFDEATVPGEKHVYTNVGLALAAYAVERIVKQDFRDLAQERVFAPLGMTSTSWSARGIAPAKLALPYALRGAEQKALPQHSHAVYPAADLRSTARDLARLGRALLRGGELDGARVLAKTTVDAMLAPVTPEQGLGFQLRELGGAKVAGHEGEDEGASAGFYLDFATGTGAVVLANGDAFASDDPVRTEAIASLLTDLLRRADPRGR